MNSYTQLLIKHFEHSVPQVVRLAVPPHLRRKFSSILILCNPKRPNHFLNGCYLILQDTDSDSNESFSLDDSSISIFQCPDKRWHHLQTWNSPLFSQLLPFVIKLRFLGCHRQPNVTTSALLSEGPALVLSMKLTYSQKAYAVFQCYLTQLYTNSWVADGCDYFSTKYPAKSALVKHETTLAWVCGTSGKAVGYVQYTWLEDDQGELHVLITGLEVEATHRHRGFGRALVLSVVARMWRCQEIWVSVQEENRAASSLYLQCGFAKRERHWNFSMRTVISGCASLFLPHSSSNLCSLELYRRSLMGHPAFVQHHTLADKLDNKEFSDRCNQVPNNKHLFKQTSIGLTPQNLRVV